MSWLLEIIESDGDPYDELDGAIAELSVDPRTWVVTAVICNRPLPGGPPGVAQPGGGWLSGPCNG